MEQAFPIDDGHGAPWLIQGVIFDITERKNAEEQVAFLAYHDKLTGLPNRALFEEMLERRDRTGASQRRRRRRAVPAILDNFKMVNDTLGHHSGDLLLAQLADRLRTCTRGTRTSSHGRAATSSFVCERPRTARRTPPSTRRSRPRDDRQPGARSARGALRPQRDAVPGGGVDRDQPVPATMRRTPRR
jgi:hypothetical protein